MTIELNPITSGYSTGLINDNFQAIENYVNDKLLQRDGVETGEINQMEVDLDMNSHFVYNLPEPTLEHQAARLQDVQNALSGGSANLITFTPYGGISSENVQGAIQELADSSGQTVTTSTGTQSLPEALEARLNAVNVVNFGVLGNGVAGEDDAAFQSALDSSFRTLYVPGDMVIEWSGDAPEIPSNKRLISDGAVIIQNGFDDTSTTTEGGQYSGFRIAENSENVSIEGFDIRGPWYQSTVTPAYRSIGIAVKGRYDAAFYDNPNYPAAPDVTPTGNSSNISILNNKIDGFGQSGMIIDNVTLYTSRGNVVTNCGRDGERHYGVVDFTVTGNKYKGMAPGFSGEGSDPNFNVYGYSATRIYRSTNEDGSTEDYRPSSRGFISKNIVEDCFTWKSLDTHGGTDLIFSENYCKDSYIGIGLDKGGFSDSQGYAPPRRIKVSNNILINSSDAPYQRSGIFAVAHDSGSNNTGLGLSISGNYIRGFGEDIRDGAIVVSNYQGTTVSDNIIDSPLRCGISLQNDTRDVNISGGIIRNIIESSQGTCIGINPSTSTIRGNVNDVSFRQDGLDTMTAFASVNPDSGYGLTVGDNNTFFGNITQVNSTSAFPNAPYFTTPKAVGNINMSGSSASISDAKGIQSVSRQSTGVCRVVLEAPFATATNRIFPSFASKGGSAREFSFSPVDSQIFDVSVRDSSGSLVDSGFIVSVAFY